MLSYASLYNGTHVVDITPGLADSVKDKYSSKIIKVNIKDMQVNYGIVSPVLLIIGNITCTCLENAL